MAKIFPPLENIRKWRVAPEEGELYLLNFLDKFLDDSFEIFFNPLLNGDRPDIVIMKEGQGVVIIEVKDYVLNHYELDERKNWKLKKRERDFIIKSPISQVLQYKDNLFELHIENLLEQKIRDIRNFNTVSCAVYFHNATEKELEDFLVKPFKNDKKYQKFLKYNIDLLGRDSLDSQNFTEFLKKRYMISEFPSKFFTNSVYMSFSRFLKPPIHLREEGQKFLYSEEQQRIVYDDFRIQSKLVKGVVGSGKTTVLAARAVENYKRRKEPILILTYNITLKNFIRDKISKVREEFPWSPFVIMNYHFFIKSELNNLGIPIEIPEGFEELSPEEKKNYFDSNYFSNYDLFNERKHWIRKYGAILIDEIQDYKRPWMEIIKDYFLAEGGEYILFGDVKQNIYLNKTENKDVVTNIGREGSVRKLKQYYRSDHKIRELAIAYQQEFFSEKYVLDTFNEQPTALEIPFERTGEGKINYIYLPEANNITSLYNIIHQNAINIGVPPNDITILSQTIKFLRDFDSYYRYKSNEKTNTMFETKEMIYKLGLRFMGKDSFPWLNEGLKMMGRDRDRRNDRGHNQLSILLTLADLHKIHPGAFDGKLDHYCRKYGTTPEKFWNWFNTYKMPISDFQYTLNSPGIRRQQEIIRNNKKIHFFMNSGTIKLSTVHSFKKWESELLFLIVERKYRTTTIFQQAFDEIIYTGLTRSRANLIILNYGNNDYHERLRDLVTSVNSR